MSASAEFAARDEEPKPTQAEWAEIVERLRAKADAAPETEPPTDDELAEEWGSPERGWYVESLSPKEAHLLLGVARPTSPKEALKARLLRRHMPPLRTILAARPRQAGRAPRRQRRRARAGARSSGRDDPDPEPEPEPEPDLAGRGDAARLLAPPRPAERRRR